VRESNKKQIPNFLGPTGFSKILQLILVCLVSLTLAMAVEPTPTPNPTPVRRMKMGDVDKKDTRWWKRTQSFLETSIAVGLFFWIPGARINYQSDNVTISK
jgi:uncharacterized membrane protein